MTVQKLQQYPLISAPININGLLNPQWFASISAMSTIKGNAQTTIKLTVNGLEALENLNINPAGNLYIQGYNFIPPTNDDFGSVVTVDSDSNFVYANFTDDTIRLYSTGQVMLWAQTTPPDGWLALKDGLSVGGTPTHEALFIYWWNEFNDTIAPVSGGRGGDAQSDFDSGKTIAAPLVSGRSWGQAGAGSGLTSRTLGDLVGEEDHTLLLSESPAHTHSCHAYASSAGPNTLTGGGSVTTLSTTTTLDLNSSFAGSNAAHNNMQPTVFFNAFVKL